jgi:hypothetical protein
MDELFTNGAAPEDLGFDNIQLVVIFLTDFLPVVWIDENFVRNGDLLDEDFEVLGKAVSFGAAIFCGVWLFLLRCRCVAACVRRRRRFSPAANLTRTGAGWVRAFRSWSRRCAVGDGDDLVIAGELGFEDLLHVWRVPFSTRSMSPLCCTS